MDILTAILACNLYTADEPLVRAVAQSNSHSNPYYVSDPAAEATDLDVPPPTTTRDEALARARDIVSKGGQPVLGLMQIVPAWPDLFGRNLADAFDPCTNIAIGSAMLSALDRECAHDDRPHAEAAVTRHRKRLPPAALIPSRRTCVIRKYGAAIHAADFEMITNLELGFQRPVARGAVPVDAPIFATERARTWGPDCVFVPLASVEVVVPPVAPSGPGSEATVGK